MEKRNFPGSLILSVLFLLSTVVLLSAGEVQYIYDASGRLSRVIGSDNSAAVYIYDSVGNLIEIRRHIISQAPPVLESITPGEIFAGTEVDVTITGKNLLTLKELYTDNQFLTIHRDIVSTDDQIRFRVSIPHYAPAGIYRFIAATLYGNAEITYSIIKVEIEPETISLQAGRTGAVSVSLNPPANGINLFGVQNSNPLVAVTPPEVEIPPGGTAELTVEALSEGVTTIRIMGAGLGVTVTPPFEGDASLASVPVSVGPLYIPGNSTLGNGRIVSSSPVSLGFQSSHYRNEIYSGKVSVHIAGPSGNSLLSSTPVGIRFRDILYKEKVSSAGVTVKLPEKAMEVSGGVCVEFERPQQ